MKRRIGVSAALLACAMSMAVAQQGSAPPAKSQASALEQELVKLEREHQAAMSEYYKPYESAKTEEEAAKIKLDPEKEPSKAFLFKFKELAGRAKSEPSVAVRAYVKAFELGLNSNNKMEMDGILAVLSSEYVNQSGVEVVFRNIGWYSDMSSEEPEKARKWQLDALRSFQSKSSNRTVIAAAMVAESEIWAPPYGDEIDRAKAIELLNRVKDQYGDTASGKRAVQRLFVVTSLSVGQVAPDFEGVDENGKAFKLSDYRGKVVVLDFWGFW